MRKESRFRKFFDYNDPKGREHLLRLFGSIATFMLVLGWVLIIYFIFFA